MLALGLACSVTSSQNRNIEVPGETGEDSMSLAQRVYESVMASDPAKSLREIAPGATDELLSKLRIGPVRVAGVTMRKGAFDTAYLQCSVTTSRSDDVVTQLLDACEILVRAHLNRLLQERIDELTDESAEAETPDPM
jgi:hypothetical protein